jgi:hypothetical protein
VGTEPIKGITRKYNAEGCKPITCSEQGWNNLLKECGIVINIFITMFFLVVTITTITIIT